MKKRSMGVTVFGVLFVLGGLLALLSTAILQGSLGGALGGTFTPEQYEQLRTMSQDSNKQVFLAVRGGASLAAGRRGGART